MEVNATQSKLLLLPVELRERIYDFTFDHTELMTLGSKPDQPPLLRVCRAIRTEALPVYYSKLTLQFQSFIKRVCNGRTHISTKTWHRSIPFYAYRHITSFRLNYGLVHRRTKLLAPAAFHVSLNKRQNSFEVVQALDPNHRGFSLGSLLRPSIRTTHQAFEDPAAVISVLREHLEEKLRILVADPGVGNLGADDLDRLIRIDPDTLDVRASV